MSPPENEGAPGLATGSTENYQDCDADSVPQGTCSNCGGAVFYLSDGYNACRTCGVEFDVGRRLAETLDDVVRMLKEYVVLPGEHKPTPSHCGRR
jgi:hypothetical protein